MSKSHFRQGGERPFFGEVVHQRAVPQNRFFRKLHKGGAEHGPPPLRLRSELVLSLPKGQALSPSPGARDALSGLSHNLSEWQVEFFVNDSLAAKYLLGLGLTGPVPSALP